MIIDLNKGIFNQKNLEKIYDYIIIGSGPASAILLNNLIKTKKKILVVERGGYKNDPRTNLVSDNFNIKKTSRFFGVGGTSNSWSQIYSLLSKSEMQNFNRKNIWPLSHSDLLRWCKKVGPKYKFKISQLGSEYILKNNFYLRKFIEIKKPLRFSKYFKKKGFDMLTNCKVQYVDEMNKFCSLSFYYKNETKSIYSKNMIICAGGIESNLIILNSLKTNKLKNLKNKKFVGRYFMDHPKCYIGEIKFPKKKIIQKLKLEYKKNINIYSGLSLYDKDQKNLNTYIRFEEKNTFLNFRKKLMIRIFLEMEPRFRNRIYIKNNKDKVDLLISKKEIETSKKLLKKILDFFSLRPKEEKLKFDEKNLIDASHHIGGLSYPKIVDKNLKFNGLKNIFCCSSAIFPTSGSVNPTLIICALSERLGNHLIKK